MIDANDHEVYGHIVASDSFCEAYVLAFSETVQDIRKELEAEHVALATNEDIELAREMLSAKQANKLGPHARGSSGAKSRHLAIKDLSAHTTRAHPSFQETQSGQGALHSAKASLPMRRAKSESSLPASISEDITHSMLQPVKLSSPITPLLSSK